MNFDEMNPLQRRLHNAAIVLESECDEHGHPALLREVIAHIDAQQAQIERLRADATRYQWIRNQHWTNNTLCVVARPKEAIRLGHDAPSGDRLDELIDAAMKYESSESEGRNDYL